VAASRRRPGQVSAANAIRDPYAVSYRLSTGADAFCHKQRQGLWVPAFAGTTGMLTPAARSNISPSSMQNSIRSRRCRRAGSAYSSGTLHPGYPH
jgi:hypothetical protein